MLVWMMILVGCRGGGFDEDVKVKFGSINSEQLDERQDEECVCVWACFTFFVL